MNAIFTEWFNENEDRCYPLDSAATRTSDYNQILPHGIIVDMYVRWPDSYGKYLFVTSVSVTKYMVSVTFSSCNEHPLSGAFTGTFLPVGAISSVKSNLYKRLPIIPYVNGAAGWVTFGKGILEAEDLFLKFSSPSQSIVLPRVAFAYTSDGVVGVGKAGNIATLTGDIILKAGPDITIEVADRPLGSSGACVPAAIIRLNKEDITLMSKYASPCGGRPESKTCEGKTPIKTINSVPANCIGDLEIVFPVDQDIEVTGIQEAYDSQNDIFYQEGTLFLDFPLGLKDICLPKIKPLPEPGDLCEPSSSSSQTSSSSSSSPVSSSSSFPPQPSDSSCSSIDPLNFCDTFETQLDIDCNWIPLRGSWVLISDVSISALEPQVFEGDSTVFRISRVGDLSRNMTVYYHTGGSAIAGIDYTALPGTATILAGNSFVDVTVNTIDNGTIESSTILNIILDSGLGYLISGTGSAGIAIKNRDIQILSLNPTALTVTAGSSGTVSVSVSNSPRQGIDEVFALSRVSGSTEITTLTAYLVFTSSNWSTPQIVQFNASLAASGTTTTFLFSDSTNGISTTLVVTCP